jgi:hypothetical protein
MVAADHPRLFQRTHPAQARRGGKAHALRQFDVGYPAFILQFGEKPAVNRIQSCHAYSIPIVTT